MSTAVNRSRTTPHTGHDARIDDEKILDPVASVETEDAPQEEAPAPAVVRPPSSVEVDRQRCCRRRCCVGRVGCETHPRFH